MDKTSEILVDYTQSFGAADVTGPVLDAAINHLVDTVAVAIAGVRSEPAQIAITHARRIQSTPGSTVIGANIKTSPELAAFANAIMVRTYDWNDGMLARSGGHPSDMIPGLLAIGEIEHSTGMDLLVAMTLAYELLGGIGAECERGGFDQGLFMAPATALAAGKLMGLDRQKLADAASLALVPNLPLGVSRWGSLSMMKGATTAFAVRSGVFAAMLARDGFTSAPEPYEGIYGLQYLTGAFVPHLPVKPDGARVVQMSHQKPIPADTQGLAVLDIAPKIMAFAPIDDIDSIVIDAPEHTAKHVGDEPKYDPRTRETADHSLPYMLAVMLVDGRITLDSYRTERFLDPALRPIMRKIVVRPDDEYTEIYKTQYDGVMRPTPRRVRVRRTDGAEFVEEITWHRGTMQNPMSHADIDAKLDTICEGVVSHDVREKIRSAWWGVADASDIADTVRTVADLGLPG
jgi:2-methylcitrate dehydratase